MPDVLGPAPRGAALNATVAAALRSECLTRGEEPGQVIASA